MRKHSFGSSSSPSGTGRTRSTAELSAPLIFDSPVRSSIAFHDALPQRVKEMTH